MMRRVMAVLIVLAAMSATAQNSREAFWRCHLWQQQLYIGGTAATGSGWQCADGSTVCIETGSAGKLVTLSEVSAGDIVSMSNGTYWYSFEVLAVAGDSSFTRSDVICNSAVQDSDDNDVLPGISASALYNHTAGFGATSRQIYDGQGNAAAFGLSAIEVWATELRIGGSSGAVCLEDDSGQLDLTDCSTGLADLEVGAITADSISVVSSSFLEIDDTLDAATGDEVAATISYTVNKASSGNDTGLKIAKTDTASPGVSYLLEGYQGSTQRFGFSDDGGLLTTGGAITVGVDGNNAAAATMYLRNTNEGTTGQTDDTADLWFQVMGTTDSGSTYAAHAVGGIKGWKEADFFGSDETDFDGGLEFWTVSNGTAGKAWYLEDAGTLRTADQDILLGGNGIGVRLSQDAGISFTITANATTSPLASLSGYSDGALNWVVVGDGGVDGIPDGNLKATRVRPELLGHTKQLYSVADTGDGSPATGTLTPTATYVEGTCNDADTCDITMGESSAADGDVLRFVNVGSNTFDFVDTTGVSELAGAAAIGQYDYLELVYTGDRWVECGRSDN